MKNQKYRILLLEDMMSDVELIRHELKKADINFSLKHVIKKNEFQKELKDFLPDIVLSDYLLPQFNGMAALKMVMNHVPRIPFILVTGSINEETAADSIKAGATDYVTKEHLARLGPAVVGAVEKMKTENALRLQSKILDAVHFTAHQFLIETKQEDFINQVLERLGNAVDVSRVYIFENHIDKDDILITSQRYEWVMPGITPQIDNPDFQNVPRPPSGKDRWGDTLRKGDIISGHVKNLSPREQKILMPQGIISILVVPIFVGEKWWGFLGFDECKTERSWSKEETEALKTAADTIGLAIQRNIAEEALKESEENYRGVVENIVEIIYKVTIEEDSRKHKVEFVGGQTEQIIGYQPDEFIQDSGLWISIIHRDDLAGVGKSTIEMLKNKETMLRVYRVRHKDTKEYRWLEDKVVPTFGNDGLVVGYFGVARDVTDQRLAQEALKKSEEQYRTLIEFSPMGVISIDSYGKITSVNSKMLEILGSSSAKATMGINVFEFKPLQDSGVSDALQLVLESGDTIESEAEYISEGVKTAYLRYIITPICGDNGEVIGAQANVEDITKNKQLEEQLRHAQKLESITRLTSGIAHDFNNILGAIFGSVDMLRLLLPKDHPADRFANIILDKSQKAANLVKQIMAYSRQQHLTPKPMNINKAIEDLSMFLSSALEERIKLKLILFDDLKPINGDKTAIDQIIMNLCVNATDAMKEGGKLTVQTENLDNIDQYLEDQPAMEPGQYVLLRVTDTGHGIEPKYMEHIFEPFFTTKEVGEGTGLGLSMVFGLVKQHEGYIFCQSKAGIGTNFEVLFPVIEKQQRAGEENISSSQLHHGGGTIMVVEDEKDMVEILEVMLTELGYDIITAFDGEKALEIYRDTNKQIDLVISDIIMPKMGGKELFRELTQINPEVKIVFTSGYASRGFHKKYDLDPEMKLLRKPFRLKEVSDIVKEVLNRN